MAKEVSRRHRHTLAGQVDALAVILGREGVFRAVRASGKSQTIHGPSVAEELVEDQLVAAFRSGALILQVRVEKNIRQISGAVFT